MSISHVGITQGYKPRHDWAAGVVTANGRPKKSPALCAGRGIGSTGPGVGTASSGGDGFFFGLFHRQADQVIEGAQGRLGAFAHGDHDLLVRHRGDIAGSKYAGH